MSDAHRLAAEERFGPHADLLLKAGWHPGRQIPEPSLDYYAELLGRLHLDSFEFEETTVWDLIAPARDILREFGGLTIQIHRPPRIIKAILDGAPTTIQGDWVPIRFYPYPGNAPDHDAFDALPDDLGLAASPIAHIGANIEEEILIAADGRILTSDTREHSGNFYCAPTFADALPFILELRPHHYPIWKLHDDGRFHERAITNVVFERTGRATHDPWPYIQKPSRNTSPGEDAQ